MELKIKKKYVIYELNNILGNDKHQSLQKLEFKSWTNNNFNTEEEAIQALVNNKLLYENYIILRSIFITN